MRWARAGLLATAAVVGSACGTTEPSPEPSPSPTAPGNDWRAAAPLLEPRQEIGVAELLGRIYAVGGYRQDGTTANTVEVYDPAADRWTFAAPMPRGVNHPMVAVFGERLYVFGGDSGQGALSTTQEYDPRTNTWGLRAPMPTARFAGLAATIGSRIYVVGGAPAAAGRVVEAYEPAGDRWVPQTPMPTSRNHVAGGVIGGRLHVVGGRPPNTLAVHEVFDPVTGSWSSRAAMPTGRSGHAGAVVRGCLYTFGGEGNPTTSSGVFAQNELYDSRTDSWQALTPMVTPRHGIGAAILGERLHVPGGAIVEGFGATGAHEFFTVPAGRTCG